MRNTLGIGVPYSPCALDVTQGQHRGFVISDVQVGIDAVSKSTRERRTGGRKDRAKPPCFQLIDKSRVDVFLYPNSKGFNIFTGQIVKEERSFRPQVLGDAAIRELVPNSFRERDLVVRQILDRSELVTEHSCFKFLFHVVVGVGFRLKLDTIDR